MGKVELISRTEGLNSYLDLNSEEIIAAVARHGEIKDDNGKLVKYLMDHRHLSPLQHISFGFLITTSRAISAQIFRHRSLNAQEFSQRYSKIKTFQEIDIRKEHPTNRQSSTETFNPIIHNYNLTCDDNVSISAQDAIADLMDRTETLYNDLIEYGVAKECARMILPMCSTTIIHITGTFRDLLAFMNIRCEQHTQKEARDIATEIGEILEEEMPNVMSRLNWRNGLFL